MVGLGGEGAWHWAQLAPSQKPVEGLAADPHGGGGSSARGPVVRRGPVEGLEDGRQAAQQRQEGGPLREAQGEGRPEDDEELEAPVEQVRGLHEGRAAIAAYERGVG